MVSGFYTGTCSMPSIHSFPTLPPLKQAESLLDFRVKAESSRAIKTNGSYILGIDAGSTTTKAVLFSIQDKCVDGGCYLRTHGNPVIAVQNCIKELIRQVDGKEIRIIQTAVTGSGREMVSVYLDNCPSFNEILSHARAASEEIPEVDTVFEIGGQDSKYISFLKGVPVDYAMNEGCSAGTGSFLEEAVAVDMGIPVGRISALAEKSSAPIAFGERCAAFINTDLRNAIQNDARQEDVIAGLVYSIADNYISRIVGVRSVGQTLLFQGGVALNRSVALAIAARTGQKVIVPSHPEMMGCVGGALMVIDLLKEEAVSEKNICLALLLTGSLEMKSSFACKACDNRCEIRNISIREKSYPFGGLCSKYDNVRHSQNREVMEGRNLIDVRNRIMFEEFGAVAIANPRGNIGLPMALTSFEFYPFYAKLINELGYNVVHSNPSKEGNAKTMASMCYPCEVAHGAAYDLMHRDVDYIFMPRFIESEVTGDFTNSYTCASVVVVPDIITSSFTEAGKKILSPHIGLSKRMMKMTLNEIESMGKSLGIKRGIAVKAGKRAYEYFQRFKSHYQEIGRNELKQIASEPTVIITGRSYTTCAKEVNLSLDRKITSRGFHVVPADILPLVKGNHHPRNMWYATQQMMNAVFYALQHPNINICLVSCFACAPDACMYHMVRRHLAGQPFCYLEIDSHTYHACFDTRVCAFLDIIQDRRSRIGRANQT